MILGLDISTSCTGYAIVDSNGTPIFVGSVDLTKLDNVFEKANSVLATVVDIIHSNKIDITNIFVEESLQAFRPGMSSANTICSLAKMNGLVSYLFANYYQLTVVPIASQTARKSCGIKIIKGINTKKQVLDHLILNQLQNWEIPQKKKKNECVNQVLDAADALVIALAGHNMIRNKQGVILNTNGNNDNITTNSILAKDILLCNIVKIWKGSSRKVSIRILSN